MRFRRPTGRCPAANSQHLLALVDIVFLLLIFFLLTFKIVAREGEFALAQQSAGPGADRGVKDEPLVVRVRMEADAKGGLRQIVVDNKVLKAPKGKSVYDVLQNRIRKVLGDPPNEDFRRSSKAVFDCDRDLKYEYVIRGITAESGYTQGTGPDAQLIKLIEHIEFFKPRKGQKPDF